jgi:hypothetical protein
MDREVGHVRERLRTPRSAAIAGKVFSLLLMASLILIRLSVPADPGESAQLMTSPILSSRVLLALNMVPFSGIAFLWFIGVIRDLIGEQEDKFFFYSIFGQRFSLRGYAVCLSSRCRRASSKLFSNVTRTSKSRRIQLWPRCNLLYFERIRHENGRSFHHIHMYNWA